MQICELPLKIGSDTNGLNTIRISECNVQYEKKM